jgi:hypothetical protein
MAARRMTREDVVAAATRIGLDSSRIQASGPKGEAEYMERAAVHEAGHGVVYELVGLGCERLTLRTGEGGKAVVAGSMRVAAADAVIMHCAGQAAEHLVFGRILIQAGRSPDVDRVAELANPRDMETYIRAAVDVLKPHKRAIARAGRILFARWSKDEEFGELSGDELRKIMRAQTTRATAGWSPL